jgi:hypothetical protein
MKMFYLGLLRWRMYKNWSYAYFVEFIPSGFYDMLRSKGTDRIQSGLATHPLQIDGIKAVPVEFLLLQ